ncbi:MAG: CPBP family intramembrane metalloprotease [Actinomycetia bacterium]|nr:CPBP family intramembrane metalloprotease [Actinomycetes bacterium]MCP4088015.1 CPBP family intramembrane metalloprotease [Actinomycetes bacterium]
MATGLEPRNRLSFGLAEVFGGLLLAQVSAMGFGVLILGLAGYEADVDLSSLSLRLIAVLQVPLWLGYLGVPLYLAKRGEGLVRTFGLRMEWGDLWRGLGLGLVTQLVFVPLLYLPLQALFGELDVAAAAEELTDRATDPVGVILLLLIVAVGAPLVEELFFRGLVQTVFVARLGPTVGVIAQAFLFGIVHLQLIQLPGLVLFGLLAGELTRRSGRLGPAIWAHVAFNTTTVVALLLLG